MSCFTDAALLRLQKAYNETFAEQTGSIEGNHQVWRRIQSRLRRLRPKAPPSWKQNPYDWLSNYDIERVMKKIYEASIPDYKFLGCHSLDFDKKNKFRQCSVSELCALKLVDYMKGGKTRLGIVFNLDPHDKPGSHWVAMFCDLRPGIERIVYFDSYSAKPEEEFQRLMARWSQNWECFAGHGLRAEYNAVHHQYKNSECGMYCLYFLHCCLFGVPMRKRVPDDVVNGFRSALFRM